MRTVHILASCRKPELIDMTTLVFRTLRIGFPNARVVVTMNDLRDCAHDVYNIAKDTGSEVISIPSTRHDDWIAHLLKFHSGDIVICDTDMVFHESVEDWQFEHPFSGAYEPAHFNSVSGAAHWERLHTSLLFVRPAEVRSRVQEWEARRPGVPDKLHSNLISQRWFPYAGLIGFADTAALLYGAIGGNRFTDDQRDTFTHLHCGTWIDQVSTHFPGLKNLHAQAIADPQSVKHYWRKLESFYRSLGSIR